MEEGIGFLKEALQRDAIDIDRELYEMSKSFSIIVLEYPGRVVYMSSTDFKETWKLLKYYTDQNATINHKLGNVDKKGMDKVIEENKYYNYKNKHLLLTPLPKNDFFPTGDYLGIVKDVTYLQGLKYTVNIMLLIVLCGLMGIQLLLINYALNRVFGALRELNDFAGGLYKKEGSDLSQRFNKSYGNREVDKLIVTLNQLVENVEVNIEKIEEFSSNVSHELKTPMASMKSMIEIELTKERSAEDYKETLIKVLEEINWMNGLIKELLNLTRNPESLKRLFKPLKLYDTCSDICEIMEMMASEANVELSWDFSRIENISIIGDSGSLKQVIMNIISNALKYNRDDGWIKVWGEDCGDTLKIVVQDCGIGIKKENLERITNRFFREDNVRTHKKSGVGLGLAIVKHILEIHKGSLEISSELGKGSIFKICLPIKDRS